MSHCALHAGRWLTYFSFSCTALLAGMNFRSKDGTALVADRDSAATSIERMAARLLTAVAHPKAAACVKGRFFDRLDAKLNQLARFDSNELVSIDLQAMATALCRRQKETV